MCRVAHLTCVFALFLTPLPSLGVELPTDNRSAVKIVIIPMDAPSTTRGPILKSKLNAERFNASLANANADALTTLQGENISHVIELRDKIAFVYTKKVPPPLIRSLEANDAAQLDARIARYLTSPDIINARVEHLPDQSHFRKGYTYAAEEKYDLALAEFLQEMQSTSKNADLYYNLALCYHRMGKAKEEEKTVDIGRKIDPEHTGLKNLLGLIALDKGNTDEAIAILSDLPDEPIFQWNLALAYARQGDLKKSQEYYKRIVTGQVDVGWSNEAERRIDDLNRKIKEKDETIENNQKLIGEKQTKIESRSSGLRIVGWSSLVTTVLLLVVTGYYMLSRRLTPLLRSIPGDQKEKLAFFGSIIVAIITLAGNVLVAVIK